MKLFSILAFILFLGSAHCAQASFLPQEQGYAYSPNLIDIKLLLQRGYQKVKKDHHIGYLQGVQPIPVQFLPVPFVFDRTRVLSVSQKREPKLREDFEQIKTLQALSQEEETKEPLAQAPAQSEPFTVSSGGNTPIAPLLIQVHEASEASSTSNSLGSYPLKAEDVIGVFQREVQRANGSKDTLAVPFSIPYYQKPQDQAPYRSKSTYIRE